jgi:hypothetical protein
MANIECEVRPLGRSRDAIPEEVTQTTVGCVIVRGGREYCAEPVPPGPLGKDPF